ncbi:class I SAM-dependent methyltransferase [Thiohalorhabdus sp. Cl-TMA]|uniref:Class I SAM-dependent methyltransferase n=1 Tax=Thiohalorhabdus methylotrophus TaxID=3242694 RepID=A0ABV4TRJ2_9GAMM
MSYDTQKAEAFGDRMVDVLNQGALSLMVSVGHRTGLFDWLDTLSPATSTEIARESGLDERYVREGLGALVTGGVVDYDSETGRYTLPPEHADLLTRRAAENVAVFAQYIPLLGAVEDDIVACFQRGGGVPYARYPRFHAVMAEDSGQTVLSSLIDHILPLAPGLPERLAVGSRVLDVGCGSGRALNLLAATYPNSRFQGFDLSGEAVAIGQREAQERGLENVRFAVRDLSQFDVEAEPEAFDLVTTFDAVHDQARPLSVLRGIHRTLKRDGVYLMQDIHGHSEVHHNRDHPLGTLLYTISCMHCMTVSLAQGGEGLGAMWGREQASRYLEEAGFQSVSIHRLDHDIQNDYYVIRKEAAH